MTITEAAETKQRIVTIANDPNVSGSNKNTIYGIISPATLTIIVGKITFVVKSI